MVSLSQEELLKNDLSSMDFKFDPNFGMSLKDCIRDLADALIRRPLYNLIYTKRFSYLPYKANLVLPEKGMSLLARRRWVNKFVPIKNSRLLILGCGSGKDLSTLLRFRPKEILGVDVCNFSFSWKKIKEFVLQKGLPTKVDFFQEDAANLNPKMLGQFDIIFSDAVFEHCRDLKSVIKIAYELLRPKGIMYASYGQFWYCWGGDHFSGRDKLEHGFNHLLLTHDQYLKYFNDNVRDLKYELTEGGGGGIFVPLDLFSKLSHEQCIELFVQIGFEIKELILEFSAQSVRALKSIDLCNRLLSKFPNFASDDFIIKSHIAVFEKAWVL